MAQDVGLRLLLLAVCVTMATCSVLFFKPHDVEDIDDRNVVCPGGEIECPPKYSCCKLKSGVYGCCPLVQAVCCSDQKHCCPKGTLCDSGKCFLGHTWVRWSNKQPGIARHKPPPPSKPATVKSQSDSGMNVVCPGGEVTCPDKTTCCAMQTGSYGCCPLLDAVCCSDGLHCCPKGTMCDTARSRCTMGVASLPWSTKLPAKPKLPAKLKLPTKLKTLATSRLEKLRAPKRSADVVCPDRQVSCPSGSTCCVMASGKFGCCPLPNAVCCSDHVHCCPEYTVCDTARARCLRGQEAYPWQTKLAATPVMQPPSRQSGGDVVCPGGQAFCADGNTCCMMKSGQYGCCPFSQAVCCADKVHCCPSGTICDASGRCTRGVRESALSVVRSGDIICPGGEVMCPTGNTCCVMLSGEYGCCPLVDANCCSDHLHCCPHGTTCDVRHGKCLQQNGLSVPWTKKTRAVRRDQRRLCPDRKSRCPIGSTCCKSVSGEYECCPLLDAVCCSDRIHCCPHATRCDITHGVCLRSDGSSVTWSLKRQPLPGYASTINDIVCPDYKSECPDGDTCCSLGGDGYGCCPFALAVCCSDHLHCCPKGFKCDLKKSTCIKEGFPEIPFQKTKPEMPTILSPSLSSSSMATTPKTVKCPNPQFQCPDQNTCCLLSSGHWGCCSLPKAVCCSDQLHCCPHGSTCDMIHMRCVLGSTGSPWLSKMKALITGSGSQAMVLGSPVHVSKPCLQCLIDNAVCCSDGLHCCPAGTLCDVAQGRCLHKDRSQPSVSVDTTHTAAVMTPAETNEQSGKGVQCPDKTFSCPAQTTCCKDKVKQWVCCPLAQAVCCKDGIHCCPVGYTCNLQTGSCQRREFTLPWLMTQSISRGKTVQITEHKISDEISVPLAKKFPARRVTTDDVDQEVKDKQVVCPGARSMCPSRSTCCRMPNSEWGCCPMPQAVCCADHMHCCPHGTRCDLVRDRCIFSSGKITISITRLGHSLSVTWRDDRGSEGQLLPGVGPSSSVSSIICPDRQHECPTGDTCCHLASGDWGCCPLPQAVCCMDGEHCCPQGYICHLSMCFYGNKRIPALRKKPAILRISEQT